jgi:hypothetical protein
MTTATERVAIVATQVAQTDRRALSQAWYSALHLARTQLPHDRRRPPSDAARRIERAVATAAHRRASQTVDLGGGRVQLLVRTDGPTTRIVAVCATEARPRVERALAQARFALAGRGLAVVAP